MREADFSRPRPRPAADESCVRNRVMRGAKRPPRHQAGARRQEPCHRMDRRHIDRLVERERRQDSRHTPRHHRLARTGWSDDEQVVAARTGYFNCPTREELPANIRQVRARRAVWKVAGSGW